MAADAPQYTLALPHAPSMDEADFVVTDSNRDAWAVATDAVAWPGPIMAIVGPEGSGKSHLAAVFAARHDAHVLDATLLGTQPADAMLQDARAAVLELPDAMVQEEALAQFINAVRATDVRLLMSARQRLAHWPARRPDLASRLKAIPEVVLGAPDDALMQVLFAKALADRQLRVPEEVAAYVLKRLERSGRAVQQVVAAIDAAALRAKAPITVPLVRGVLGALMGEDER